MLIILAVIINNISIDISQLHDVTDRSEDTAVINQMSSSLQSLIASFNTTSSPILPLIQASLHTELSLLLPR